MLAALLKVRRVDHADRERVIDERDLRWTHTREQAFPGRDTDGRDSDKGVAV